ncbi:MAG TPA: hypothetical protein VG710_11650 [Opitutus sp.]|nr:hypothetical protein [Opitutus sp.]
MSTTAEPRASRWQAAWPDAAAFAGGLAVAWFANWRTTDLVWSLWLSSLTVGFAMIVWMVTAPLREMTVAAARDHAPGHGWAKVGACTLVAAGTLFGLAFFCPALWRISLRALRVSELLFPDRAGSEGGEGVSGTGAVWRGGAAVLDVCAAGVPGGAEGVQEKAAGRRSRDTRGDRAKEGAGRPDDGSVSQRDPDAPADLLFRVRPFRAARKFRGLCGCLCGVFFPVAAAEAV